MDFSAIMKLTQAWNTFRENHPKFPAFLSAVKQSGIREGTVVEIVITQPDGNTIRSNVKVKQSDLDLFTSLKDMSMD